MEAKGIELAAKGNGENRKNLKEFRLGRVREGGKEGGRKGARKGAREGVRGKG